MSLEKILSKEVARTAVAISGNREKAIGYLTKHELSDYLSGPNSESYKELLSKKLDETMQKYDRELNGFMRKAASKGTMWFNVANQIYGYFSKVPTSYIGGTSTALFLAKTIVEIPAMYNYLKKSKDWYGATGYILTKPVRWLLPVIGPALESGAFERMVMKGILNETKREFLKEIGKYNSGKNYFQDKLKSPIGDSIELQKAA